MLDDAIVFAIVCVGVYGSPSLKILSSPVDMYENCIIPEKDKGFSGM